MSGVLGAFPAYIFANLLIGLLLSLLLGWVAMSVSRHTGLMDVPGALPHKRHSQPTPLAGGITLALSLAVGLILLNPGSIRSLWAILVPTVLVFALGLWDDFRRLRPSIKLLGQVIAVIVLIALGTYVRIVKADAAGLSPQAAFLINCGITLIWMVGITNAFNLVDSMDGLVVGLGAIAIAFLVLATLSSQQIDIQHVLALLLGICGGLYFYNVSPAHLFLGDSGSQTIGFLLGAVAILYNPLVFPQGSSWFLPILILGVPIFDTTLVVVSRIRERRPIFRAGQDHTYHHLIERGYDSARAVALMHIAAVALGCVGFIALNLPPLYANLLFAMACLVGLGLLIWIQRNPV
jgi:UDP-GlcNAc:undecaprenyl-phosphate GlcNAc-1-phosphate transferase